MRRAFTLIEILVAVTVFTLFIGFAIGAYLSLHDALRQAEERRHILLESERILHALSEAIKSQAIDYDAYAADMGTLLGGPLEGSVLHLQGDQTYQWDEEAQILLWEDGETEHVMNEDPVKLSLVKFRVFPGMDPYATVDADATSLDYYQPNVQITLQFTMNEQILDFQTSVTSRHYR